MKRYCETTLQGINPCDIGWGMHSEGYTKTCRDEPMEQNCHHLVDADYLFCPVCGSKIGVKK